MLIFKNFSYKFSIFFLLLAVSCSFKNSVSDFESNCGNRGYNFSIGDPDLLVKGLSTKEKALEYLGYPTFVDFFSHHEKWIYHHQKICRFLFFPNKIHQHKTIVLLFDNDLMIDIKLYQENNGQDYLLLNPAKTKMPKFATHSWIADLFSNIGKITPR